MKKALNIENFRKVTVIPPEEWEERSRDWSLHDPDRIFVAMYGKPLYINAAFPDAALVQDVCAEMMTRGADAPDIDELSEDLRQLVGLVSAEWFFNQWIFRRKTIYEEERKARAEAWINATDYLSIIDGIAVEYDAMYEDFWRYDWGNVGANAAFAYGVLIGRKEAGLTA